MDMPPMEEPPVDLWEPPVGADAYMAQASPVAQASFGREAPTPKPVAQAAVPKPAPAPKITPAPVAPAASKRVLRPIKTWTEAVDRVRDTSRMAASFLVSAKAYTTEDGRVVIKLESDFIRSMVSREGAPEALRAALSVCLGRKLDTADILYEVEDAVKTEGSLIDEIIEAAEE